MGDKSVDQVLNIKVDGNSAARIVVNIEGQDKVALIDTGAGRCCMNEEQYRALGESHLWNLRMWGSNYELLLELLCQESVSLLVNYR